jgi:murein DD-endopeptidase MepM/ murein hydrolase activator NlpD
MRCVACVLVLAWRAPGYALPASDHKSAHIQRAAASRPYRLDADGRPAYLKRFHDGPRRVPVPHGAPMRLAQRLGIGDTSSARMLLSNRPPRALRREVSRGKPRTLLWPVLRGRFGRGFGFTRRLRKDLRHNGVDIGAAAGTPVRSASTGLVVYSDNGLRGYGNCVMILHGGGLVTLYAHNRRNTVQAGQRVVRGERIGLVGRTGYAWGPHLHFELRDNGRLRDPMPRIVGRRSDLLMMPHKTR